MVRLIVDGREIEAEAGENLLVVCLRNGIYIPNLCYLDTMEKPHASCRLCFVELDDKPKPVPSCTLQVRDGMVVRTDTPPVRRLQQTALRLLLSVHRAECRKCPSNRRCVLQNLARLLGVRLRPRRFDHIDRHIEPPRQHPCIEYVVSRCVLCGRCVHVCERQHGKSFLTFAKRGFDTIIASLPGGDTEFSQCCACAACVDACPVSALLLRDQL
ncbi:MAG: 2Fe-2S iron-sulfur cluster-binding protein [Syntrophobacteraceae bacterium]